MPTRCSFQSVRVSHRASWIGLLLAVMVHQSVWAQTLPLEIHEWSVWVTEVNQTQLNAVGGYPSAMPGLVDTFRSRKAEPDHPDVAPLSVITFSGPPTDPVDVLLRMTSGRFVGQWPEAETKNNRLAWHDLKLNTEPGDATLGFVPEDHWFVKARQLDVLHVLHGARAERFIAYDPELNVSLALRVEGGPDKYKLYNSGKYPLKDVLMVAPASGGQRIGWLDDLPASKKAQAADKTGTAKEATAKDDANDSRKATGAAAVNAVANVLQAVTGSAGSANGDSAANSAEKTSAKSDADKADATPSDPPVEIEMTGPLDEAQLQAKAIAPLRQHLIAAGLKESEADLLLSMYSNAFFHSAEPVLLARLPQATIDDLLPLEVDPDTAKISRVALVMVFKIDPQIRDQVKTLVAQLADNSYEKREQAEARLRDLGRMAVPALKEAAKSSDPEQVMRAERLLIRQGEKLDGK
ncbi:MAG TPA: hypothetical protein VMJ32_06180 [Pirellulales bacterium]|nr:hypothetical protein [Pirellulales bacterium]